MHVTSMAGLSVLGESSLLFTSSWGFFHCFPLCLLESFSFLQSSKERDSPTVQIVNPIEVLWFSFTLHRLWGTCLLSESSCMCVSYVYSSILWGVPSSGDTSSALVCKPSVFVGVSVRKWTKVKARSLSLCAAVCVYVCVCTDLCSCNSWHTLLKSPKVSSCRGPVYTGRLTIQYISILILSSSKITAPTVDLLHHESKHLRGLSLNV